MDNKKSFAIGLAAGIVLAIIVLFGYTVYDRQMRWSGQMPPNAKIQEIYNRLSEVSIFPFDKDIMMDYMYRGFLDGVGDPYTQYFDADALEAFRVRTSGEYVGIGVLVAEHPETGHVTVMEPFRGSPAEIAGMLPGDKIVGVDGEDMEGRTLAEVIEQIQGREGTTVVVTVYRPAVSYLPSEDDDQTTEDDDQSTGDDNQPSEDEGYQPAEGKKLDIRVARATVTIPTVFHEMIQDQTGYIRIGGFDQATSEQFSTALEYVTNQGMKGLVLDVRNNPGGILDVVAFIADHFVPEGVITFTVDANGRRQNFNATAEYLGIPLVVLINGRSASASELLSGAIQDTGVGVLVGEQTFGKGIVQHLYYLSDGTAIKATVAKYFTPNGTSIHGVGVAPDFEVEMDDELSFQIGRLDPGEDVQLEVALQVLRGLTQ